MNPGPEEITYESGDVLSSLSHHFGTGNIYFDFMAMFLICVFMGICVYRLSASNKRDRSRRISDWPQVDLSTIAARLDELELSVREHIRISQQTTEHFKGHMGFLKHELLAIRELLDDRDIRPGFAYEDPHEIPRGQVLQPKRAQFGRR
jgi:hypothetical protein